MRRRSPATTTRLHDYTTTAANVSPPPPCAAPPMGEATVATDLEVGDSHGLVALLHERPEVGQRQQLAVRDVDDALDQRHTRDSSLRISLPARRDVELVSRVGGGGARIANSLGRYQPPVSSNPSATISSRTPRSFSCAIRNSATDGKTPARLDVRISSRSCPRIASGCATGDIRMRRHQPPVIACS